MNMDCKGNDTKDEKSNKPIGKQNFSRRFPHKQPTTKDDKSNKNKENGR
jgi:hypothetical protein